MDQNSGKSKYFEIDVDNFKTHLLDNELATQEIEFVKKERLSGVYADPVTTYKFKLSDKLKLETILSRLAETESISGSGKKNTFIKVVSIIGAIAVSFGAVWMNYFMITKALSSDEGDIWIATVIGFMMSVAGVYLMFKPYLKY